LIIVEIPVRIVLVETSHPGNVGAAARAMKTMGLSELALVAPRAFPHAEATAMASGADDLLARAKVYDSLTAAISDCSLVVGASARLRNLYCPIFDPRECARHIWRALPERKAALVMGPEQSGLTNEDLGRCQFLVNIPTQAAYGSLNLAMAVQVLCYELRMAAIEQQPAARPERESPPATAAELEGFHEHLERVLSDAGFLKSDHPRKLKLRFRRMFQRAELDQTEVNILRGVLSALDPAKSPSGRH